MGRVLRARGHRRQRPPRPGRRRAGPRHLRRHDPPHRAHARRAGGRVRRRDRRGPGGPARAAARVRRALLLRHDRPVRERRRVERHRRDRGRPARPRLRPDGQGLLPRRGHRRPALEPGLHRGPGHDRDLADAVVPQPSRPGHGGRRERRLPRVLDHRLHPDRPAPRDQRGAARPDRRRARARHQGLLRHHHQPHGGRDRLRRGDVLLRRPGDAALHRRRGQRLRPGRARRDGRVPGARPGHVVPVHARRRARGRGPQGPRVAQRRHALPQPR